MPRRTKKKFIDKKSSVTFHLVHRSQRDPLAADDEAPQRVLVPADGYGVECDFIEETPQERDERISMQRTYGIGFNDDYDYMQHLREPDRQTAVLVPKDPTFESEEFLENLTERKEVTQKERKTVSIKLPSLALPSKEEEEIGMLHRAIPPVGPQVDWDPDVVAAMDEDFDYDDPENILDNDFILQAMGDDVSDDDNSVHSGQDSDFQMSDNDSTTGDGPDHTFFDQFLEEETKSRFTEYSMTSSVLPRTDQLKLLDERFEKFFETYDDDKIGDLSQYEVDGTIPVHDISQNDVVRRLLGIKEEAHETGNLVEPQVDSRNAGAPTTQESIDKDELSEDDESESEDDVKLVKFYLPEKPKYDCESILSTYSNKYNHPKMIYDDDISNKPIKLSKKTGIPLDTLPTRGLTAKLLQTLDLQNSDESTRIRTTSDNSDATYKSVYVRRKDETKDEKAARKKLVKEIKRERRAEKKSTKLAFRQERTRQSKVVMNIQQNLKGIKIS